MDKPSVNDLCTVVFEKNLPWTNTQTFQHNRQTKVTMIDGRQLLLLSGLERLHQVSGWRSGDTFRDGEKYGGLSRSI